MSPGKYVFFAALVAFVLPLSLRAENSRGRHTRLVDSLISVMTLEEKIGQLTLYSSDWTSLTTGPGKVGGRSADIKRGLVGSLLNLYGAEATHKVQRMAVEESRLKIPLMFGLDVVHGFRTTFPIPLAEASTWDTAAVERSARIAAIEATAAGLHWTFAPMVDIARDPRWGRIAEGSGEDTYLGSVLAAARVRGFQGSDLSDTSTLLACPKHYAAYGGGEGGRDYNTVDISERTLREVYLPPFEAAVRAGAATIMCSFNEIGGIPSTGNHRLLTNVLRGEWGFEGFVVSDWGSIGEMRAHGIAGDSADAARLAIAAGTDMDMESDCYRGALPGLVRSGRVPMTMLDTAVRRILLAKASLGLFDDPYRYSDAGRERSLILSPDHLNAAREIARESIVLLKNDGDLLPLPKKGKRIAVIGPLAESTEDCLGPWSAVGRGEDVVSVLAGIQAAAGTESVVLHAAGCAIESTSTSGFAAALDVARQSDVVVMVLGETAGMSGEAASRASIGLPGAQLELLQAVHAVGKPVVVVLMNGRPLAIPWLAEHVPAMLECWFLGVQTGNAVADVVFGDHNPGGKLPVSFPRDVGQVPIYYNHKNTGRPGIAGVKYTSQYLDLPLTPQFPFGYGLSYTTFNYANLRLSADRIKRDGKVTVSVDVTNAGARPGTEVVQLYIRDDVATFTPPVRQLRGFRRIALAPGEKRTVTFELGPESLSILDANFHPVVEPGTFHVYVGTNSVDTLEGGFVVVEKN